MSTVKSLNERSDVGEGFTGTCSRHGDDISRRGGEGCWDGETLDGSRGFVLLHDGFEEGRKETWNFERSREGRSRERSALPGLLLHLPSSKSQESSLEPLCLDRRSSKNGTHP